MINKNIIKSCLCGNVGSFVPHHQPVTESDVLKLKNFLLGYKNTVVLTGAGISTESGIPDYRSKDVGLYARSNHKPITYQDFIKNEKARKQYWCRSFVGWPRFSSVTPNLTHVILSKLENTGFVSCIVTQNVDNLHFKVASKNVIELHGTLYRVICTHCRDYVIDRHTYQKILQELNPFMKKTSTILRPDGDVELTEEDVYSFNIINCPKCSGFLKPDVVFFGENVPAKRVHQVKYEIDNCTSLVILGSSLSVYSAFRIVLQAAELHKPVCIVNIGETRGDNLATLKISAKCGEILPAVFSLM